MNGDNERDPIERLRAADPAAEVDPRPGFVDQIVAQVTDPESESAGSAPVADLAAERARRRPRWITVAAVAASIAIVGAAGYGIGTRVGGATNLADGAAPSISLQTGASPEGIPEPGNAPADDAATSTDQKASGLSYPYGFGRNFFSASGLGNSEATAPAYAFDAGATLSADRVAALAAALGIEAPVEQSDGAWTAGPQDGSAPVLSVGLDGTLSFYFQNPGINPWICDTGSEPCEPVGKAPAEDAALEALRSLLVAAGMDPAAFEMTSHVWENSPTRTAEARPVVGGQRIDQPWSLELAEGGVVNANGALAEIVGLGDYPVVSEQEAFERLSDPRFGGAPTTLPIALRESTTTPEEYVPPTAPPATPSAGTSVSWPVNDVRIVSARLGLASQWQPDGSVLVVPAYEFTDTDGGTWSVIAVAESVLDFESE